MLPDQHGIQMWNHGKRRIYVIELNGRLVFIATMYVVLILLYAFAGAL